MLVMYKLEAAKLPVLQAVATYTKLQSQLAVCVYDAWCP